VEREGFRVIQRAFGAAVGDSETVSIGSIGGNVTSGARGAEVNGAGT
jgi:hypothetical protein